MATPWQKKLAEYCNQNRLRSPVYNIVSDRRGGRTAWSATVDVNGTTYPARYWYDGQYLNNAKEDAAEVACTRLGVGSPRTPPQTPPPVMLEHKDYEKAAYAEGNALVLSSLENQQGPRCSGLSQCTFVLLVLVLVLLMVIVGVGISLRLSGHAIGI